MSLNIRYDVSKTGMPPIPVFYCLGQVWKFRSAIILRILGTVCVRFSFLSDDHNHLVFGEETLYISAGNQRAEATNIASPLEQGLMNIQYIEPLKKGVGRMNTALFHPFDLGKWFVIGFTAFLADLLDFNGGGTGRSGTASKYGWDDLMEFPRRASDWMENNPGWMALIIVGVIILVVLAILATWLSSRGKFMLLDNVVYNRARVALPWSEYRAQGNSLFLWRLVFGFALFLVIALYAITCFSTLRRIYELRGEGSAFIGPVIGMALGIFVILLVVGFVNLLLSSFIVPLMYRDRIKTNAAWLRFFRLFSSYPMEFIGYGLLVLSIIIMVIIGVVLVGFLTCCIGFLLLVIPYINSVVLLPVTYALRAFSVEFLEQFGPEYRIFPAAPKVEGDGGIPPA